MRRVLCFLVLFSTSLAFSQQKTFEGEVKKISLRIDKITKTQKDSLELKIKEINKLLDSGKLTPLEAEKKKKEAASYHANRIEKLVGVEQDKLQQLVQDKTDGKIFGEENVNEYNDIFTIGGRVFSFKQRADQDTIKRKGRRKGKIRSPRTRSEFVFGMGLNNVLENNSLASLENSPYQVARSRFYELGFSWKYRLTEKHSPFHLRYGFSFLWNNLRPDNQQYHIFDGNQVDIIDFPTQTGQLGDARLRHVQLIFPLHFELDFSKPKAYVGGRAYRKMRSWRIGMGGFVGFKLGTRQYLEYRDLEGVKVEQVQRDNFNMNEYNYGLSAYIAHRGVGFYVKYDLNPLFQNTEIKNLSMGLRFDFN